MRVCSILTAVLASTFLVPSPAFSLAKKPSRQVQAFQNKLKAAGVQTVACPKFVNSLKSGWTSALPAAANLVCLKSDNLSKAFKGKRQAFVPVPSTMIVSGRFNPGRPFDPVVDQEGDVQTDPFEIGNVPAVISYRIENANYNTLVTISLIDLETGDVIQRLQTIRGEHLEKDFAYNYPGTYYLKIQAEPDEKESIQPKFSVQVNFEAPEAVGPFAKSDLAAAGIKPTTCPAVVVDIDGLKSYKIPKDVVCSTRDVQAAGFSAAPINLAKNLFLESTLERSTYSDDVTKPFRVKGPTRLTYSVDDPSQVRGRTIFELINLSTGKRTQLASVRGSIAQTTTFINEPGDYFIRVDCTEYKPKELGAINWTILVDGGA